MNIIFFNSKTLVTRELINALKKRNDIRLITTKIPLRPPSESVQEIFNKFKEYTPAIFLSINDAGYDLEGKLQELELFQNPVNLDLLPKLPEDKTIILDLRSNHISSIAPLAKLPPLYKLDLSDNDISDISPIAFFPKIYTLRLAHNKISDLSHLVSVNYTFGYLDLSSNLIKDLSPLPQSQGARGQRRPDHLWPPCQHHGQHPGRLVSLPRQVGGHVGRPVHDGPHLQLRAQSPSALGGLDRSVERLRRPPQPRRAIPS